MYIVTYKYKTGLHNFNIYRKFFLEFFYKVLFNKNIGGQPL